MLDMFLKMRTLYFRWFPINPTYLGFLTSFFLSKGRVSLRRSFSYVVRNRDHVYCTRQSEQTDSRARSRRYAMTYVSSTKRGDQEQYVITKSCEITVAACSCYDIKFPIYTIFQKQKCHHHHLQCI